MGLTKHKLNEFVELYVEKCGNPNLTIFDISGINSDKEFFEPSKQAGIDTSNYKNVPANYFACNLMHVGRDKILPIALNHSGKNKIVSPAYTVFRIKEGAMLLREYFFMLLKSAEKDRFFWFHTDSSVRDGMSWEEFCDLEIELPSIKIQKKYVDIYSAMIANQLSYENGVKDLKVSFAILIDRYKHSVDRKCVSEFLKEIDCRNEEGVIDDVQGINIMKQFMPSVADTDNVNLKKYKIVKNGQFAYSGMQTGRDKCIRIALYNGDSPIIISPAYSVMQVKSDEILPEYIMMWFFRGESDRRGWFMSDASIRANLDLERFLETEIPIPEKKIQESIVKIYNAYKMRNEINEKLKNQIKEVCPILIKGSLQEGE